MVEHVRGAENGRATLVEEVMDVEPVILRCSGEPRPLPDAMQAADRTKVGTPSGGVKRASPRLPHEPSEVAPTLPRVFRASLVTR